MLVLIGEKRRGRRWVEVNTALMRCLCFPSFMLLQVTKSERQIMKPLYDRYRLVKQILCRASTIPVIVSVTSEPLFFLHSCLSIMVRFHNRAAKIIALALSKPLQTLNPSSFWL